MNEVLLLKGVDAAAAASIFHFTEQTPLEAKRYLKNNGIVVRVWKLFNKDEEKNKIKYI